MIIIIIISVIRWYLQICWVNLMPAAKVAEAIRQLKRLNESQLVHKKEDCLKKAPHQKLAQKATYLVSQSTGAAFRCPK